MLMACAKDKNIDLAWSIPQDVEIFGHHIGFFYSAM